MVKHFDRQAFLLFLQTYILRNDNKKDISCRRTRMCRLRRSGGKGLERTERSKGSQCEFRLSESQGGLRRLPLLPTIPCQSRIRCRLFTYNRQRGKAGTNKREVGTDQLPSRHNPDNPNYSSLYGLARSRRSALLHVDLVHSGSVPMRKRVLPKGLDPGTPPIM